MVDLPVNASICITFVQCWSNVEDVGPSLCLWYTNVCVCWAGETLVTSSEWKLLIFQLVLSCNNIWVYIAVRADRNRYQQNTAVLKHKSVATALKVIEPWAKYCIIDHARYSHINASYPLPPPPHPAGVVTCPCGVTRIKSWIIWTKSTDIAIRFTGSEIAGGTNNSFQHPCPRPRPLRSFNLTLNRAVDFFSFTKKS